MFTIQIINISMGEVDKVVGRVIQLKKDTWSPGLWSGCEGATMKVGDFKFTVESINLHCGIVYTKEILDQSLVGKDIRFGSEIK